MYKVFALVGDCWELVCECPTQADAETVEAWLETGGVVSQWLGW